MSGAKEDNREEEDVNTPNYSEIFGGVEIIRGPLRLKKPLKRFADAQGEEEEEDGLTEAQRAAERAKEKRMIEAVAKGGGYKDRIKEFNAKLAKQTEHNEMPRISGQ